MLRNTFVLTAAYTLARPQNIIKCSENAIKRLINASPAITKSSTFNTLSHTKWLSTNAPNLQKDE